MLREGSIIMLVGMGIVFLFLVLIVLSMRVMSGVVFRFFPEKEEEPVKTKRSNEAEIAAVLAAVQAYRKS